MCSSLSELMYPWTIPRNLKKDLEVATKTEDNLKAKPGRSHSPFSKKYSSNNNVQLAFNLISNFPL